MSLIGLVQLTERLRNQTLENPQETSRRRPGNAQLVARWFIDAGGKNRR